MDAYYEIGFESTHELVMYMNDTIFGFFHQNLYVLDI